MEHFLYRIHPTRPAMLITGPTEREKSIIEDHFAYLTKLALEGSVFLAGRTLNTGERTFGIVVFAANSQTEAAALIHS